VLTFEVDTDKAREKVQALTENVEGLKGLNGKMFEEFVAWQEDDMRRKYANLVPQGDDAGYTLIWPRSRLSTERRKRRSSRTLVRPRTEGPHVGAGRPHSMRPILRPELFEKLQQRMSEMLKKVVPWA